MSCVTSVRARLGEGPLWDAARRVVWWLDIKGPAIHAYEVTTGVNRTQPLDFRITALGLARDGQMVAAGDPGFVRLAVAPDLTVTVIEVLARVDEHPGNRFNDGKIDSRGDFWAGTMDDNEQAARGSLYRLRKNGQLSAVRTGISVPNGPTFLADGTVLTTDSVRRLITALALDESGNPISERVFAQFQPAHGYPDGMTVDAEDHVWIAFWDGWCVRRLSPEGEIVTQIALPVQRPTCPVFAGDSLDQLYVTSATIGLSPAALDQQPLAGGLLRLVPGAIGCKQGVFGG
jgi:sugar lactone lactonase YvrE